MPYTPILATLGYVMSPDGRKTLLIHRNTREYEFRIEPVTAFLQITAIGHLRHQVSCTEKIAEQIIARIIEFYIVDIDFVAGKMHQSGSDIGQSNEPKSWQVGAKKFRTA